MAPPDSPVAHRRNLSERVRLLRNSGFNLLGVLIPAALAVVATPVLLSNLGPAGFGALAVQLAVLTIIGVNDFGVSRAMVLEAVARGGFSDHSELRTVTETGVQLISVLAGLVVVLGCLTLAVAAFAFRMPSPALTSWLLLVFSSAVSLFVLPLRASLEVQERFGLISLVRATGSSLLFLAPMVATMIWPNVVASAGALLASRIFLLVLCVAATWSTLKTFDWTGIRKAMFDSAVGALSSGHLRLLRLAGWLGLAGLFSTIIGYVDRFALGMAASVVAVGHYVVASELVTKIWLVTGALTAAATPRLAHAWRNGSGAVVRRHFFFLAGALALIAMAGHIFLMLFGEQVLRIWLSDAFDASMVEPLRILSVGIAINALSSANFLLLMLGGRERSAALVQLVTLPVTFVACLFAARWFGSVGVAWVFTGRLAVDALIVRSLAPRAADGETVAVPFILLGAWGAVALAAFALL